MCPSWTDRLGMNNRTKNITANGISIILVLVTVVIMWSTKNPLMRSISEFSVHIMLGMLGLGMVFLAADRKRMMFSALACAAILALWLKNASNDQLKLPQANSEAKLKIAHINLSNIDDNFTELIDIVKGLDVDVLSFQELTPDWATPIRNTLYQSHPYFEEHIRIDPYGMAIYSKYDFHHTDTILSQGIPSICVDIPAKGKVFHVVSSYLTPALDNSSLQKASAQLDRISKEVQEKNEYVIALGEYNMVYWTQEIREFRSKAKLKNSRRDISQSNLRVPYDHIFYTEDLQCVEFKEMKSKNQKYLGIMGTYQIKSQKQKVRSLEEKKDPKVTM